jgi:peptidyl-prolyl cis-trans isomerase C
MKLKKSLGVMLAVAAMATFAQAADTNAPAKPAGSKIDDLFPDPVIAKGKGFEIKRGQLDDAVSGMRNAAMARGRELQESDMPIVEKNAFDHLLQVALLLQKATPDDKAKATIEADKRLEIIKKRAPSPEALDRQLKAMDLTLPELEKRLVDEAAAEQVLRDLVPPVTDADTKKFYDENPKQFEEPEQVRASHILLLTKNKDGTPMTDDQKKATLAKMQDILKRARAGEDFAKLAKEYSEDPGSKDKGGEYTFPRGQMVKEFEAAAFSLNTNQISDVVTTQYGYHIIKLHEKIPAKKIEYTKVAPDIKNYLESLAVQKILPAQYEKLKKDADVQILDPQLKTIMDAADAAAKTNTPPAAPSGLTPAPK